MKRKKPLQPPLQICDVMCRRCNVQPTLSQNHICEICKALGKSVEPEEVSRQEDFPAAKLVKALFRWMRNHLFFVWHKMEI